MNIPQNTLVDLQAIADQARIARKGANLPATARRVAGDGYFLAEPSLAILGDICDGYGVCVHGTTGTGKTYLFKCLGIPALNLCVAQGRHLEEIDRALESYANTDILRESAGVCP